MDEDAVIFLAVLAAAAAGGWYFTWLLCRLTRVHWYWAVVGTAGTGLLIATLVWLGFSMGHGDLGEGIKPLEFALLVLVVACGCALIPAVMTVLHYRYYRPRSSHSGNVV
jgi:hypothetical protein